MYRKDASPSQLSAFYEDFFVGDSMDDVAYLDGLIVSTSNGHVATLYARGYCKDARVPKTLRHMVHHWAADIRNPFDYSIKALPKSIVERIGFADSVYRDDDSLLTIMGVNLDALVKEVNSAKRVLQAMGLRHMGPANAEDEKVYNISTQKLAATIRQSTDTVGVESSIGLTQYATLKGSVQHSRSNTDQESVSVTVGNDEELPVGATREWLFLKALAVVAGVDGQPATLLNMYHAAHDDHKNGRPLKDTAWNIHEHMRFSEKRKDSVNDLLNDASKVRAFLTEKIRDMQDRFHRMQTGYSTWKTTYFSDIQDIGDREAKDKQVFKYIEDTLDSIGVQAQYSLAGITPAPDVQEDLFAKLDALGDFCRAMGGIEWAANGISTLAYTSELLSIIERGALFFQQETVNRINEHRTQYPAPIQTFLENQSVSISGGYGQRVEGKLVRPGLLPAGFPDEFPCVQTDESHLVMVPSAYIEQIGQQQVVLVVPPIPVVPTLNVQNTSKVDIFSDGGDYAVRNAAPKLTH